MKVSTWIKENDIDARTISLCIATDDNGLAIDDDDGDAEPWFSTCDITGIKGNVYRCSAATTGGDVVYFTAGDWLIGGALGRIAGAF